jgi:hypothetical protein
MPSNGGQLSPFRPSPIQTTIPESPTPRPSKNRNRKPEIFAKFGHHARRPKITYHLSGDEGSGTVKGGIAGKAVYSVEDQRCLIAKFAMDAQGAAPLALAKGLDASEGVKLAWRQKIEGQVVLIRPASEGSPSPTPSPVP